MNHQRPDKERRISQLGHTLRCLRVAANLPQKELAQSLGITANYLSLVEHGHREPSLTFLRKFGAHLHIPLRELLWIALADDEQPMAVPKVADAADGTATRP